MYMRLCIILIMVSSGLRNIIAIRKTKKKILVPSLYNIIYARMALVRYYVGTSKYVCMHTCKYIYIHVCMGRCAIGTFEFLLLAGVNCRRALLLSL